MKLETTTAKNSFKYSWLLSRIFPYIKPYLFRIILGFMVAIPLGLLDGVTAFALKPYMDYVIGGKSFAVDWHGISFSINPIQMAFILPIGVILFAAFQGVLRYLNGYLSMAINLENTNIDYNKEFFKIDLPQEKKRAFEIYDKYEGGKQLFPDDYATQAANMINDKLEYGRNINHDIFLKYCKTFNQNPRDIANRLMSKGYIITNIGIPIKDKTIQSMQKHIEEKLIPWINEFVRYTPVYKG